MAARSDYDSALFLLSNTQLVHVGGVQYSSWNGYTQSHALFNAGRVLSAVHDEHESPRLRQRFLPDDRAARLHLPHVELGALVRSSLHVEPLAPRRGRQQRFPVLEVEQRRAFP